MSEAVGLALHDMIHGYWKTQIVHAVAKLSIADHLANDSATLETLAQKTGADTDALRRLLRAAAALGLIQVDTDGRFASTPVLAMLREGAPGSLRAMAMTHGSPGHWLPWGRFIDAMRTGEDQSKAALGRTHFDHYAHNREEAGEFIKFMQSLSELVQKEVVRSVQTGGVKTVVDIGGANGALVCALLKSNAGLKGIVYDLAHSHESAVELAARQGLAERVAVVSGDFFKSVPAADLYLLKFILHDWDDAAAIMILSNCRRALNDGGRVVVVEMHLGEMGEPGFGPLLDLNMMAVTGGRERTITEYGKLLAAADLQVLSVTRTNTPFSIIEAGSSKA